MFDIYAVGEMVIDMIPGKEPDSYLRRAGGAPANVAIAAAKNGLKSAMACKVGNDEFGHFLMDTLKEYNVIQTVPELTDEAITTIAFVTLREDGERVFTFARKPGADMMLSPSDVKEKEIEEAVIIHAGSCSLSAWPASEATVKALRIGHEKKRIVSFDVNYRNLMWKDNQEACAKSVMNILPYVDMLKISEEEEAMLGGWENIKTLMKRNRITVLVETLGKNGARTFFDDNTIYTPGKKVKAVDATGAGDAFWGAFLSSLRIQGVERITDLTEDIIRTAMEYGNMSGSICVQSKGAVSSIPTRDVIESYLVKEE